jgi:hypothetical protein
LSAAGLITLIALIFVSKQTTAANTLS